MSQPTYQPNDEFSNQSAYQPVTPATQVQPLDAASERQLMAAAHWSAIASSVLVGMTFVGPLVVLLAFGHRSPRVRQQAVDALNFQITTWLITGGLIVIGLLTLLFVIGIVPLIAAGFVWFVALIFHGVAALRVWSGEEYRYPFTLNLIK